MEFHKTSPCNFKTTWDKNLQKVQGQSEESVSISNIVGEAFIKTSRKDWEAALGKQMSLRFISLDTEDFLTHKVLGKTNLCITCEMEDKKTNMLHLARKFKKNELVFSPENSQRFLKELCHFTQSLLIEDIPRVLQVKENVSSITFIYDTVLPKHSPYSFMLLKQHRLLKLTEEEILKMFWQLLSILAEAQSEGTHNHDLSMENILVLAHKVKSPETQKIKIIGFKNFSKDEVLKLGAVDGALGYIPPEILYQKPEVDLAKVDSFSAGAILYEL